MHRRALLLGCGCAVATAGCLEALSTEDPGAGDDSSGAPSTNETADDDTDAGSSPQVAYWVHLERPADSIPESDEFCRFSTLSERAQAEFERSLADRSHRFERSPAILEGECYNTYVRYEGAYHWVSVSVDN